MSTGDIATNAALLDADLKLAMDQGGVSQHCQALFGEAGFTSTKLFRSFGTSADGVTKSAALMGLKVAKLQAVWSTACAIQSAEDVDKAEKKVLGITRQLRSTDYNNLKVQYQKKHGKKKDDELPGAPILEKLELDLEEGEFRAPKLTEIPSKEEVAKANTDKTEAQGWQ